ncbi:MAG: PDZ domain-containing protein [Myxococcales bacterium]
MAFRENLERMARIYEGVAIFSVERGSTTHRAGIRAGDILMSVNGRRIRHHSEYSQARRLRAECIELVVMRQGRELRLWAAGAASSAKTEETVVEAPTEVPSTTIASVTWRGAA